MNKIICVGAAAFSFMIGFLFCASVFVFSGENTGRWGDLATWVGSSVSCLALIAAITAAMWSKKASDVANENSTFLTLNNLIEMKSQKFSLEYIKMESHVEDFKKKIRCIEAGSVSHEKKWGVFL